jgi:hypothetical protein
LVDSKGVHSSEQYTAKQNFVDVLELVKLCEAAPKYVLGCGASTQKSFITHLLGCGDLGWKQKGWRVMFILRLILGGTLHVCMYVCFPVYIFSLSISFETLVRQKKEIEGFKVILAAVEREVTTSFGLWMQKTDFKKEYLPLLRVLLVYTVNN